jgi:hypothetical protein
MCQFSNIPVKTSQRDTYFKFLLMELLEMNSLPVSPPGFRRVYPDVSGGPQIRKDLQNRQEVNRLRI